MPIENINVIDLIAHDPATDEVALVMTEPRPWFGSDAQLFQFQEKLNTYLSFALDGEMLEAYPQFEGKKVRLQLECQAKPDPRTQEFISVVQRQISFQEIKFEVKIVPGPAAGAVEKTGCDGSCDCGGAEQ
ncbi:MAG: DUF6572 domain-containing protein [Verrucomicrobiota bacterium]